jgi:hypothetical protein
MNIKTCTLEEIKENWNNFTESEQDRVVNYNPNFDVDYFFPLLTDDQIYFLCQNPFTFDYKKYWHKLSITQKIEVATWDLNIRYEDYPELKNCIRIFINRKNFDIDKYWDEFDSQLKYNTVHRTDYKKRWNNLTYLMKSNVVGNAVDFDAEPFIDELFEEHTSEEKVFNHIDGVNDIEYDTVIHNEKLADFLIKNPTTNIDKFWHRLVDEDKYVVLKHNNYLWQSKYIDEIFELFKNNFHLLLDRIVKSSSGSGYLKDINFEKNTDFGLKKIFIKILINHLTVKCIYTNGDNIENLIFNQSSNSGVTTIQINSEFITNITTLFIINNKKFVLVSGFHAYQLINISSLLQSIRRKKIKRIVFGKN